MPNIQKALSHSPSQLFLPHHSHFIGKGTKAQSPRPHSQWRQMSNSRSSIHSQIFSRSALEIVFLDCGWQISRDGVKRLDREERQEVSSSDAGESPGLKEVNGTTTLKSLIEEEWVCPGPGHSSGSKEVTCNSQGRVQFRSMK